MAEGDLLRTRVCAAPSPIHGIGLFARMEIPAGTRIGTYKGPRVRHNGAHVLWVYGNAGPPIGRKGYNLLRYLNHDPLCNAEFDGFELYAKRDILPGKEITIDYGDFE